jgi:hypothetical protein
MILPAGAEAGNVGRARPTLNEEEFGEPYRY